MTAVLEKKLAPQTKRDPRHLAADIWAVRAIARAAINVELFTIPLYMVALYSIKGTHPINAKDIEYYKGRLWPGSATTANPTTTNEEVFNIVFSVFVQEMLHLQMAANLAKAIGAQPYFTGAPLQDQKHGWIYYSDKETVIPYIIDLQDTENDSNIKVKLDALNKDHIKLFLAIEQDEAQARSNMKSGAIKKYFPTVPFANWDPSKKLPMFGTIGWLYECYACYLSIEYWDGQTLWDNVYDPTVLLQKDMFNYQGSGHQAVEFPYVATTLNSNDRADEAFNQAIDMMSAITDQGEGHIIPGTTVPPLARWKKNPSLGQQTTPVQNKYRPDKYSLELDYPSYTDTGCPAHSRDAKARYPNSAVSHYERFEQVKELLAKVDFMTWDTWHNQGNQWTASMLTTKDYDPKTAPQNIPKPEEVAGALNRLKQNDPQGHNYQLVSQAAVGAIAGITTVLDKYWQNPKQQFPYPSMVGSGDRVSICWAIFGKVPDLSLGIGNQDPNKLYHACQGLNIEDPQDKGEAPVEVFHSCRGSNECKAQGGCGFAQLDKGGGLCGSGTLRQGGVLPGEPTGGFYSSPSDNKCETYGGCAVPISASQLFPKSGTMTLYNFDKHNKPCKLKETISFNKEDSVYDKAWDAYGKVMKARHEDPGQKPTASDLRVAFPPST